MSFPKTVIENLLVACNRSCCICHKQCGSKIEIHHIVSIYDGGKDTYENAIALCFDCHAEVKAYNDKHPKGRKFSPAELKKHKERWLKTCEHHSYVHSKQKVMKSHIEMCWEYRPLAYGEIKKEIMSCKKELFMAGMGLNTVSNILCDPEVVKSLIETKGKHQGFKFIIITLNKARRQRIREEGGTNLKEQLQYGQLAMQQLIRKLQKNSNILELREYDTDTTPRHFILKADDTVFVGSYLSHQKGSHSYLMKFSKTSAGMFDLFMREVDYLKKHSDPI